MSFDTRVCYLHYSLPSSSSLAALPRKNQIRRSADSIRRVSGCFGKGEEKAEVPKNGKDTFRILKKASAEK
jgi:hypothetical protein